MHVCGDIERLWELIDNEDDDPKWVPEADYQLVSKSSDHLDKGLAPLHLPYV